MTNKDIRNIINNNSGTIDLNEKTQNELNNKIINYENTINQKNIQNKQSKEFLNLSLNDIFKNFTKTLILILNDIVIFIDNYLDPKKEKSNLLIDFLEIFINEDRLIYVGLFFVLISFFIYFMDISS